MKDAYVHLPTESVFTSGGLLRNGESPITFIKCNEHKDNGAWTIDVLASLDYSEFIKKDYIIYLNSHYGYQPFRINNPSRSTIASFMAHHVGFDLLNYVISNSTSVELNCQDAMAYHLANMFPSSPFTVYSDIQSIKTVSITNHSGYNSFQALADAYNGYLDFDGFQIRITANRGADRGVNVEYGMNLSESEITENWDNVITKLKPIGNNQLTIPGEWLYSEIDYGAPYTKIQEFDSDNVDDLLFAAQLYLARWQYPQINYKVTTKITDSDIYLGDTISVISPNFTIFTEVISLDSDRISEVLITVEFGNYRDNPKTYIDTLKGEIEQATLNKAQFIIDEVNGRILLVATNAATAQTQANLGVANAALAQTKADQGVADALVAHNLADNAQTTANSAQTSSTTANGLLADLASDSKLTAVEKQQVKIEWDAIVSEKVINDTQATAFSITTEKTNYGTSYSTLSTYITPLLASLIVTSDIVGTTFRATFKDYYDKRQLLLNAIASKSKTLADAAQSTANTAVTNAATAQTQANLGVANAALAQAKADTAFANAATAQTQANTATTNAATANGLLADLASDNKLTAVEKQLAKKEWDAIVSEKTLNDTQATTFGITTEKTAYGTSYTTLSTYITPLLTDLTITSDIVGATFRANFKDYYDKLTTLLNAIAGKAKALADTAQTQADQGVADAEAAQTSANAANNSVGLLTTRVNAAEQLITPTAITTTVESNTSTLATKAYVQTTADGSKIAAEQQIRNEYGETISNIETNFVFDVNGLKIGKSGSAFSTKIDNNEMGFYDGSTKTAYVSGGEFLINKGTVISSLTIGVHKIEKYSSGITIFRFVG